MVILEAISSGFPLVARDIPEFTEHFEGCGLFFSNNDPAGRIIEQIKPRGRHAAISRAFSERYDIKSVGRAAYWVL